MKVLTAGRFTKATVIIDWLDETGQPQTIEQSFYPTTGQPVIGMDLTPNPEDDDFNPAGPVQATFIFGNVRAGTDG